MQIAKSFRFSAAFVVFTALLTAYESASFSHPGGDASTPTTTESPADLKPARNNSIKHSTGVSTDRSIAAPKTGEEPGKRVAPSVDCDGDGNRDDVRIGFESEARPDECVVGTEQIIPEPPFQQTYAPSAADFYSRLPAVGWSAKYQCGEGLYEVTLARPAANALVYSADGITISTPVTYDDLDPSLNQPLIITEPVEGIRYSFDQMQEDKFYEYAIADYGGSVGFYIYQTGQQIVALPCQIDSDRPTGSATTAPPVASQSSSQ